MDLTFSTEEQAFAAEARDLARRPPRPVPAFESRRGRGRVGSGVAGASWRPAGGSASTGRTSTAAAARRRCTWPSSTREYTRAGAPQPVNRVGINLAGPTLLAHGTDDQKRRWIGPILTAEEIWCQLFSEPDAGQRPGRPAHHGHPGRRRVGAQRPEGLDLLRPVRPLGHLPGPHRHATRRSTGASRTWWST